MPKKKQINVSIPEEINIEIDKRIEGNKEVLKRMGLRNRAQVIAAILENGIVSFDRIVQSTKQTIEAENHH